MSNLHCPSCGYRIGTLTIDRDEPISDVAVSVNDWLKQRPNQGHRVRPHDLYAEFIDSTNAPITARRFGLALRELGVERTASQGLRYWNV